MNQQIQNENVRVGLGVFVIIFNPDFSKVLFLKRNEEKRKRWNATWGNVGGKLEKREYSLDGILREAREEIGIDLDKSKIKFIHAKEDPNFTDSVHAVHFIYATTLDESTSIKINSESDEYKWFSINNLPDSMLDKPAFIMEIREKAMEIFK